MLPLMLLTSTFNSLNLVKLGPIDKMLETAQGIRNLSVRTGGPSTEWGILGPSTEWGKTGTRHFPSSHLP